jgi:hypothetical protein
MRVRGDSLHQLRAVVHLIDDLAEVHALALRIVIEIVAILRGVRVTAGTNGDGSPFVASVGHWPKYAVTSDRRQQYWRKANLRRQPSANGAKGWALSSIIF